MTRRTLTLLLTALTLSSSVKASEFGLHSDGDHNNIRANTFGNSSAQLTIKGSRNRFEFFAGPCPHATVSKTLVEGDGQQGVIIPRCN